MSDDYVRAMEAAGAEVVAWQTFGTYQGDGWGIVRLDGVLSVVQWSFGSCSQCDEFLARFGYSDCESVDDLAKFGREIIDGRMTFDDAVSSLTFDASWDVEADAAVEWLRKEWSNAGGGGE